MKQGMHARGVQLSAAFLALALIGCQATAPEQSNEELSAQTTASESIRIGIAAPLTGGLASLGQDIERATQLALGENPLIAGQAVELILEDAQCDATAGLNAVQKLVSVDQVQVVFGAGCSGATLAAAPVVNDNQILLFSSASTSPDVSEAGEFVVRNAPSDALSSVVMAEAIQAAEYTEVAIISENTDFSQAYRDELSTLLAEAGVAVAVDEVFNPEATDFKTSLQKVKDSNAQALINLANNPPSAGLISKQAQELGVELPEYGTDVFSGEEYLTAAQNTAEGNYAVLLGARTNDQRVQDFLANYEATFGEAPSYAVYAALAYDRAKITQQAIEAVGYDATAIRDYLLSMPAYDGLGGMTEFDANGDSSLRPLLHQFIEGELVPVQ